MHSSAFDSDSHKTTTLHDVAKAAGVSVITASRALSNPHKVSEKTIAKVRQAVQSTGYVPNLVAGSLKSRRSNTVGLLVPAISVAQFLPTVEALTTVLASHGYQVILGQVGYDYAHEELLIQTMVGRRVDGIVAIGLLRSALARKMVQEASTPLVETWDFSDRPADMLVGFSHLKVGSAVAGYFLSKGWHRVGLATGDDHRAMLRKEGFIATMPTAVTVATIVSPGKIALGRQALRDLLVQQPDLQAVFCSSDLLAQGVLVEAQARGLRIPEDLAICGFGDADFAAHLYPSLSSVKVDGAAIGRHAAQMVLARCRGQSLERPVLDLGFLIQERSTTTTQ